MLRRSPAHRDPGPTSRTGPEPTGQGGASTPDGDFRIRPLDVFLAVTGWLAVAWFTMVTVIPGLGASKVFLGTGLLTNFAPWLTSVGHQTATNVGVGDTLDSATPMAELIVRSTQAGHFPLWDPFNNGGGELGALPNAALLSPLSLPWWFLPASAATAGVKLLEILAVGLGMHLLLRRQWRLPLFTAPLATLVFVSSGFMIAWTNWPQTRVAAMIPLLFWASDRLATRHRWTDCLPMGVVVACMLLGGFPAITGSAIYTAAAYFLVRTVAERTPWATVGMSLVRSAVGVLLGVALSAVQMLPFIWFTTHYVDFESRSGFRGSHLPFEVLATSIVPSLLGIPDQTHWTWTVHFIEGFSYFGAATLILLVAALLVRPRTPAPRAAVPFFTAVMLLCGSAVYFGGPTLTLLQALPGVATSPIGRLRVILGFGAAVLCALGAAAVFRPTPIRAQFARPRNGVAGQIVSLVLRLVAAAALLVPPLLAVRSGINPDEVLYSQKWILVAALLLIAVGLAVLFSWVNPSRATGALAVLVIIGATVVPSAYVAHKWWPLSDAATFYPSTPTHEFLAENLGEDRYATVGQTMLPGTSSFYQLRSVTGHGFTAPSWRELTSRVDSSFFQTPTYTTLTPGNLATSVTSPVLDRLGVKYVVQAPSEQLPGTRDSAPVAVGQVVLSAAGGPVSSPVFTGPARGVTLSVMAQSRLPEAPALLTVRAVTPDGTTLATTTSQLAGISAAQDVALALEGVPDDQEWRTEVTLANSAATITFAGTADGEVVTSPVRGHEDGLRVVHTGDSTIIERLTVRDRIRWASHATVEADATARLALLSAAGSDPDTVVLEHESDNAPSSDSTAKISVSDSNTDTISTTVASTGPGWLVVADPLRGGGWTATIDGEPAPLLDADHATVAIRVPGAGTHEITLSYEAPLFRVGSLVSAASALLVGVLVVLIAVRSVRDRFTRRNARSTGTTDADGHRAPSTGPSAPSSGATTAPATVVVPGATEEPGTHRPDSGT